MKRFKNILFVDGKPESRKSLEKALGLAKHNSASLTVVEVLKEIPEDMKLTLSSNALDDIRDIANQGSKEHLKDLIASAGDGVRLKTKVLWGTPFLEIIREVLRNNHDLVIVSPKGSGGLKELLFGSLTMHLMRKCPCPVWAIKPSKGKQYDRILAAVDPTPLSDENRSLNVKIMELALSLAHSEKSELHVVHCWAPFFERILRDRSGLSQTEVDGMIRETRNSHKSWFDELLSNFDLDDISYKVHLLQGEPEKVIPGLAQKKRVELVVMGTLSRTGLAGFFIGNTAEKVLQQLDCSVLAIKPDGFVTPVELE